MTIASNPALAATTANQAGHHPAVTNAGAHPPTAVNATAGPPELASAPATGAPAVENLAGLTRADFPLLGQTACLGQPLIYMDHAATSQKPRQVLDALLHYYSHDNANE
jgi:selenocysteine lyase/cysteine desulfurase